MASSAVKFDRDEIAFILALFYQYVATACWFVKTHAEVILHK